MIDPEFEVWLGETWQRDTQSQRPDPLEAFFERCGLEKSLGSSSATEQDLGNSALNEFREFVKAEKQKVPIMRRREIRTAAAQALRKAADVLAPI